MKNDNNSGSMAKPLIVGVAGAAAGAVTMALMDKDKRKQASQMVAKLGKAVNKGKEELAKNIDKAQDKMEEVTKNKKSK